MRLHRKIITIAALLPAGALCLLGGCSEYLDRHDRISMSAGDSIAHNKAIHVVDPWPAEGFNTRPRTMGQRAVGPVQRYRDGGQQRGGGSPAPAGGTSVAAAGGMTSGR